MPATTRRQRASKTVHMFDLPRETLVVILESPVLTAVDLARFACVSKKENSKQLAMEAAKNRVLKAWPESELNYKRNDDQVYVKPSEGKGNLAYGMSVISSIGTSK